MKRLIAIFALVFSLILLAVPSLLSNQHQYAGPAGNHAL
jgi:hypothetical protein